MRRERRAANVQKMKRAIRNVEVQIDELILHGFAVADRYIIGDAFTRELGGLFKNTDPQLSLTEAYIPMLNAGRIILPSNAKPASVGMQAAQAVYGSLNSNGGDKR